MSNKIRTGARTYLNLIAKACKLSHTPGFRIGLTAILGAEDVTAFYAVFTPFCSFVDGLVEADNWFNKFDTVNDDGAGEDGTAF